MSKKLLGGLLAIASLVSCREALDINEANMEESRVFYATIEDTDFSADTKTSLDTNRDVLWKLGDQVSIFAGSSVNEQYQVTDDSDGKTEATLNKVSSSETAAGTEINNTVALYPYTATASIEKNGGAYVISGITLPDSQTYAVGSFGNGTVPMVAVNSSTSDLNLDFKNVLGALKLQFKGTATIKSITVIGNNNEILCGPATITTGDTPSISLPDASAKTVTLNCGDGVQLNSSTATSFFIALPPMTMTGGFTVTVKDTEGKQMVKKTTLSQTIARSRLLTMPVVNYVGSDPYLYEPFTITSVGSTSVAIAKTGSPDDITLEYKKGNGDWSPYTIGTAVDLSDGETLQFRAGEDGNSTFSTSDSDYYYVSAEGDGDIKASGNITSLLDNNLTRNDVPSYSYNFLFVGCDKLTDASDLILPATALADYCYDGMFAGCMGLTSAPELPATTLADYCYANMFSDCTALTTAPGLLATTLALECCFEMFSYCTELTTAPELPATTLADGCYDSMFRGCTALTTAPALPATTLACDCYYNMFLECESLATAPELPATTLANTCYANMFAGCTSLTTASGQLGTTLAESCCDNMFSGCTSLTTAPALPATTLAEGCYASMFSGCSSLTTAPELPAATLVPMCYSYMFHECSELNYVKALFTTTPDAPYTRCWLIGVSSTGTFVKSSSATWDVRGDDGIPASSGWTIQTAE